MKPTTKRIVAALGLLAFSITLFSGLAGGIEFEISFFRSIMAGCLFGLSSAGIAFVFEKLWRA